MLQVFRGRKRIPKVCWSIHNNLLTAGSPRLPYSSMAQAGGSGAHHSHQDFGPGQDVPAEQAESDCKEAHGAG